MERKALFLASGGLSEYWPRQFVFVNVIDATTEDYDYLLEDNDVGRRYYIQPQGVESPFYEQLLLTAEVTITKEILDSLIIDRGA